MNHLPLIGEMPIKDKARRNEVQRELMKKIRGERRIWLDSLKEGKPCSDCGVIYPPYVLDWHHRDPKLKLFKISWGVHKNKDIILTEIAKCELVCANCHRIRTHGEGGDSGGSGGL